MSPALQDTDGLLGIYPRQKIVVVCFAVLGMEPEPQTCDRGSQASSY
jgi:hypothetical protein